MCGASTAQAQTTYTFTPTAEGTYDWTLPGNWDVGVPVSASDSTVRFFANNTTALGGHIVINTDPATLTMNELFLSGRGNVNFNTITVTIGTAGNTWTLDGATPRINIHGAYWTWNRLFEHNIRPGIVLSTNLTVTGDGTATPKLSGPLTITGGHGIVKNGTSTLSLSGTNAFTGDITISGGGLTFSTTNAWGGAGKNVTFTGSGALLSSEDGYIGGQLSVQSGTATIGGAGSLTFATTTGSGALLTTAGQNKTLNIGDASSFTGDLGVSYGTNNASSIGTPHIVFSKLNDAVGSSLKFYRIQSGTDSDQNGQIGLTGDNGPLTFYNRQVQLLPRTYSTHPSMRDIVLLNNNATPANKWVINTPLMNNYDRDVNFYLSGSNAGDNEFAGAIGNSTNGTYQSGSGILNLYKHGTGRWILSVKNTYTGITTVSGGTLVLRGEASIADTGTLNIAGGQVEVKTREAIAVLQINGTPVASGVWGTTASGAPNVDNVNLIGAGKLYVGVGALGPAGTLFTIK
jgi:fibronectin-binding autotransporter adhesin